MPQLQVLLGENGAKFVIWAILGLATLIAVLLLILVLRRLFGTNFNMSGSGDRRNRPPRLGVTDFFNLDRQGRRLVIVRRDNVEHLVLIGGPNDLLIEQNIIRGLRPELPIIETPTRPTVNSKATEDVNADSTTRPESAEQRNKNITPEIQVASKLNIPKLNIPNLDLRTSTPAASASVQKSTPAAIEPTKIIAPIPEVKEQVIKSAPMHPANMPPVVTPEAQPQKPIEIKAPAQIISDTTAQAPTEVAPAPVTAPIKKPLTSAFGDAAKRLEEALRRPIDASSPKPSELKAEPPKPIVPLTTAIPTPVIIESLKPEPQKVIDVKKLEPAPAQEMKQEVKSEIKTETKPTSAPAQPAPQPDPPQPISEKIDAVTDVLVLDLEQEMARLLGRAPGKGL
jgi:flagellar protein FliO/FliZ